MTVIDEIKSALEQKGLVERAVWLKILSGGKWQKGTKSVKFRNLKSDCEIYLIPYDQDIKRKIDHIRDAGDWDKFVKMARGLQKEIIEGDIVAGINSCDSLRNITPDQLVCWAQIMGALLSIDLKTAQIRKFLGAVTKLETDLQSYKPEEFDTKDIAYLKVYLAYAAGRHKDTVRPLLKVMVPMIAKVSRKGNGAYEDFKTLVHFVRAIVAYHKFYGGAEG